MFSVALMKRLDILEPGLKDIFWSFLEEIERDREESVTKKEFNELKEIVRELGQRVSDLSEAQRKTELKLEALAEAQKRTEQKLSSLTEKVEALAEAQKQTEKEVAKLSKSLNTMRHQIGGLSKSMAYALENEAFRKLPVYLKTRYQIQITEQFIRTLIQGEEINLFARAELNGEEILVVGESVLRLDDYSKTEQVKKNVTVVEKEYNQKVIPLIITHFAHPDISAKAKKENIIVIQSFEWEIF